MKRRSMVLGMAGSCLAAGMMGAEAHDAMRKKKRTFVLVHGGWHGGWCFKKMLPLLEAAGHDAWAPTLTGMGERAHLLDPGIDLDTHVQDVVNVLEYEDLHHVVLLGHSSGGMVVAGAYAQAHARIAHVVYLDAFLPDDGKALSHYAPVPPTREDGWRVPPIGPPEFFGVTDPRDIEWMAPRFGDQPVATFTQPVRTRPEHPTLPRASFIQCTDAPWFVEAAERARRRNYAYYEMFAAGHDAMVTMPRELTRLLLEIARK